MWYYLLGRNTFVGIANNKNAFLNLLIQGTLADITF